MNEKRFTLDLHPDEKFDVINDNSNGDAWGFERYYRQPICNQLNKLNDENEQLKSENLKLFNALKSMCDVEICQVCKHNELLIFESMMYPTEYDTRCKKGFKDEDGKYHGIEVHECDCFEVCEEW